MTQFGAAHAYASTTPGLGDAGADSEWLVNFHLSGDATLTVGYYYHLVVGATRGASGGPAGAGYKFDITSTSPSQPYVDPGGSSFNFLVYGRTIDTGNPDQYKHACSDWSPNVRQEGGCAGTHEGSGALQIPFRAGPNTIGSQLFASGLSGGVADAFDTGLVTYIIVPEGVAFAYDDVNGNPLNVGATSATPEPATWAMAASDLLAVGFYRRSRARR